jgi:hypothetical protein
MHIGNTVTVYVNLSLFLTLYNSIYMFEYLYIFYLSFAEDCNIPKFFTGIYSPLRPIS